MYYHIQFFQQREFLLDHLVYVNEQEQTLIYQYLIYQLQFLN